MTRICAAHLRTFPSLKVWVAGCSNGEELYSLAILFAEEGLADRTIFYLTSELGRTPNYNPGHGKDHWSVTSAMIMGAGVQGNRLYGASTHGQLPRLMDPETLEITDDEAVGVRLRPSHVHAELRHLLGITDSPLSQKYALEHDRLGIL